MAGDDSDAQRTEQNRTERVCNGHTGSEALTRDTRHLTQAQGTHTLCSGMLSTWWVVCASHATAFGPTTAATIGSAYVGRAMMTLLQPTICAA